MAYGTGGVKSAGADPTDDPQDRYDRRYGALVVAVYVGWIVYIVETSGPKR